MHSIVKIFIGSLLFFFIDTGIVCGQLQILLSDPEAVMNPVNYPHFAYFPDGHISVLPDEDGYIMFWAEFESHRSIGTSQFVEDQTSLEPANAVFGRRGNFDTYDNGGSWLMSVFRIEGDSLIGFFHAEDHWYPHTSNNIAWKSLGVTYSGDEGKTWSEGNQIITSPKEKPETPEWGGSGDCCVIWDHINNRWICYYQEHNIYMAVSEDPKGVPGSWKKYYNGAFEEPGLGGQQTKVPGLIPGANPSVHWNTYLEKWVMVWHGWSPAQIYLSVSEDAINWETPQSIIVSTISGRAWYPTIIGITDVEAGQIAKIYYADIASDFSFRNFETRTITFIDEQNNEPAIARIDAPADGSTINDIGFIIKTSADNLKAGVNEVEFYVNDILVGTDDTYPFELEWIAEESGEYKIQTFIIDNNNDRIASDIVNITLNYTVGIKKLSRNSDLAWITTVVENTLTVNMQAGNKQLSIYDLLSNKVFSKELVNEHTEIDVSGLSPGLYFLLIKNDRSFQTLKFIKR